MPRNLREGDYHDLGKADDNNNTSIDISASICELIDTNDDPKDNPNEARINSVLSDDDSSLIADSEETSEGLLIDHIDNLETEELCDDVKGIDIDSEFPINDGSDETTLK